MIKARLQSFVTDETGAVTVDWVVLTAAIVGLGMAAVGAITGNMGSVGAKVNTFLGSQTINTTFN